MNPKYVRPDVRVKLTRNLPEPNEYVQAMLGEYKNWCFDEEETPKTKGHWRSEIFKCDLEQPVDLEIGTGNGFHFAHYAEAKPERNLVGFELKYKPLVQSIRRARRSGCENVRICRYDARLIGDVFAEQELNDVIIHFPDPYLKKKFRKRRVFTESFLAGLFEMQRPGSNVYFKTDSEDYFDWCIENFKKSQYEMVGYTRDLHASEFAEGNFRTAFENIFLGQGLPIYYCHLIRR